MKNKKKPNVNDPAISAGYYPMIARGGSTPPSEDGSGVVITENAQFYTSQDGPDFNTAFEEGDTTISPNSRPLIAGDRIFFSFDWGTMTGMWVVQESGAPVRAADWPLGAAVSGWVFSIELDVFAGSTFQVTNTPGNDIVGTDTLTVGVYSG